MYKLKEGIKLGKLQDFGYKYVGNYNRGDQWLKEIDIIVDGKNFRWNFNTRMGRNRF